VLLAALLCCLLIGTARASESEFEIDGAIDANDAAYTLFSLSAGASQQQRARVAAMANTDGTEKANEEETNQAASDAFNDLQVQEKEAEGDVNSAAEQAKSAVGDSTSQESEAVSGSTDEAKSALQENEQAQEEALSNAKDEAMTRMKVTEDMAENWEQEIEGRLNEKQSQAQEQLKAAQEASQKRIEAKKEELMERFKAAETRASVEREEQDRAAMTRLQAQIDLGGAEKLTLESFVKRADAKVQLAETESQTQLNGEIGVSAGEQKRLGMDEEEAAKLGSDLEQEHNTVVKDAVLQTAEMQAQTKKQLETLQKEKDEKLAEASQSAAADQAAMLEADTQSTLAQRMQNVQMASNLQTATILAGTSARRPAWI